MEFPPVRLSEFVEHFERRCLDYDSQLRVRQSFGNEAHISRPTADRRLGAVGYRLNQPAGKGLNRELTGFRIDRVANHYSLQCHSIHVTTVKPIRHFDGEGPPFSPGNWVPPAGKTVCDLHRS